MNAETKIEADPLALLRKPFPEHHISKLPKETRKQADERKAGNNIEWKCAECGGMHHKNATHLDYVGHAALTDRLLDVDPHWTWEPMGRTPEGLPVIAGGLWIKLTVCGVSRYGFGAADGKTGGDAIKEMIGDALRNAAMRFGAALDLWHKGDLHVDDGAEEGHGQQGAVSPPAPDLMPDAEYNKLIQLVEATGANVSAMLKFLKIKVANDNLRLLNQTQFAHVLDALNTKLAAKAKAATDAKAKQPGLAAELADEIRF